MSINQSRTVAVVKTKEKEGKEEEVINSIKNTRENLHTVKMKCKKSLQQSKMKLLSEPESIQKISLDFPRKLPLKPLKLKLKSLKKKLVSSSMAQLSKRTINFL